ncbi:MAG TPA: carboxypeptidase-like regulatory domain-containing protein [Candidatus Angelobacter sp.]|nr:carboxypeptidase-like regulatory domain-containing protein [Candidatus Angelobacter sp.]
MQAYATLTSSFLTGQAELELKDDYNPVATIQLRRDETARVTGIVLDESNHPLEGVRVAVVGYDAEAVTTTPGGNFSLPAHKADEQQVQLFAFKDSYDNSPPEWHQAGEHQVTIVLRHETLRRVRRS